MAASPNCQIQLVHCMTNRCHKKNKSSAYRKIQRDFESVMLPKTPKSGFWKFVKGSAKTLFVIEAVCFAASYGVYYRMNTNREFRHHINVNYPFVLDYYYKFGELLGNSNLREVDATVWRAENEKEK